MDSLDHKNLQALASVYLKFLIDRNDLHLKKFLSLDFITRKNVTTQINLIKCLPQLLYGFGPEAYIWDDYLVEESSHSKIISPFQFDVFYTHHMNMVDTEKTTITIHSLVYENDLWRIQSILNDSDHSILENLLYRQSYQTL